MPRVFQRGFVRLQDAGEAVADAVLDAGGAALNVVRHAAEAVHDVDLLTIDTEGHDALVLEGAAETLAARRVKVLEFEYSGAGMWKNGGPKHRTLKATLERLHRLRYECFWAGKDGHVAPASGPFWCDAFEFHEWSNLLCAHAPRVLHVLYELARRAGNVVGDAPLDGDRRRAHW